eukprot:906588-Prorocentrum_minimum.AAC.1
MPLHKGSTRGPQGVHKGSARGPQGVHEGSARGPRGVHEGSTRGPQGVRKGSARGPRGVRKGSARGPRGVHKGSARGLQGVHKAHLRPPFAVQVLVLPVPAALGGALRAAASAGSHGSRHHATGATFGDFTIFGDIFQVPESSVGQPCGSLSAGNMRRIFGRIFEMPPFWSSTPGLDIFTTFGELFTTFGGEFTPAGGLQRGGGALHCGPAPGAGVRGRRGHFRSLGCRAAGGGGARPL